MDGRKKYQAEDMIMICSYCSTIIYSPEQWDNETDRHHDFLTSAKSHGICPDCLLQNFPQEYLVIQEKMRVRIKRLYK